MTITPAAQQLIEQVTELRPDAQATVVGDADGIGVHRTVAFDAETSAWLAPYLDAFKDERIESVDDDGITFVPDTRADFRAAYPFAEVGAVLDQQDESPRKRASKKA